LTVEANLKLLQRRFCIS